MNLILRKISLVLILVFISSITHAEVFEDFSESISLDKFTDSERNLTVNAGELIISSRGSSSSRGGLNNAATLLNSNGASNFAADLKVTELNVGNSQTQQALLRLFGDYYSTGIGRAFVSIAIGDRGNGLEAWYIIYNDEYDSNGRYAGSSDIFIQGSLASSGLSLNTSYRASIDYNGDNQFTFTFNNGVPVTVNGPVKTGDLQFPRAVGTRVRFGHNTSTPDIFDDELPEDGSIVEIVGTVDNVTTGNGGAADDFSTTNLDKWSRIPNSTLINDEGKLEMTIAQDENNRITQRLSLIPRDLKYFGAKLALSSESSPGANALLRSRIVHYLGNDTYDIDNGDTPNGFEGNLWSTITLQRSSNSSFSIYAYIERANDRDYNSSTEIIFQPLLPSIPANYDVEYDVAIETVDKVINFIIDGEVLFSFDLTSSDVFSGNLYKTTGDTFSQLNARIQNGPGKVVAIFDDVVTARPTTNAAIDIDGNGEVAALTDGLMILRHLFGFQGESLITGAIGLNATRTSANDISANIDQLSTGDMVLDIDGDGSVLPLTDGLLILRHLFGFSGDSLITGAIGSGATRDTAEEVETYLSQIKTQASSTGPDISSLPEITPETGFTNENVSKGVWYFDGIFTDTDINGNIISQLPQQGVLTSKEDNSGTQYFDINGTNISSFNYSWVTINGVLDITFDDNEAFKARFNSTSQNRINMFISDIDENGQEENPELLTVTRALPFDISDLEGKTLSIVLENDPNGCTATNINILNSVGMLTNICPDGVLNTPENVSVSMADGLDNLIQIDFDSTATFLQLALLNGNLENTAEVMVMNFDGGLFQGITRANVTFVE